MDPFSVAASIIAILQLSGKISSLCFDLYTTVGARKELGQIIDEIESLRSILQKLARIPMDKPTHSRACAYPIALQTKHLLTTFQHLFAKHHEGIQQPTKKALVKTLRATLEEIGEFFLIIDALDECTSRVELLRVLQQLLHWKILNLHLMLTSRKEKDIEDVLRDMPQIAVQGQEHHQDIQLFV